MKKEIKTELTKEKILAAAISEFGANGYAGATINNICSTGIAKGLLYHNFKNKEILYLACVKKSLDKLIEHLRNADIANNIQRYMEARISFFRENKNDARLFYEAILQPPEGLEEDIAELRREYDEYNLHLYKNILETMCLRNDVPQEDAIRYFKLLQEMFNGYFSTPAAHRTCIEDTMIMHEEWVGKIIDFMLYGIAKRGEEK